MEKCGRAGQATGGNTIRRMQFTCWITMAADTDLEYVILIVFQRQEWFRERSSILRYTYFVCFSFHFICPLLTVCFLRFVSFTPVVKIYSQFHVFSILTSSRFFVMKNHACRDNFYAVSSSFILV